MVTHRYSLHFLWCFSSFSSVKSLGQEMIICPNSSQGDILPIYKWVNTLIITNWPESLAYPVLLQFPAQSHYPCQVAHNPFSTAIFSWTVGYFHPLGISWCHFYVEAPRISLLLWQSVSWLWFLPFFASYLTRTFDSWLRNTIALYLFSLGPSNSTHFHLCYVW